MSGKYPPFGAPPSASAPTRTTPTPTSQPQRSNSRPRTQARGRSETNELEEQLAFTKTLLSRYQEVVESSLKPQLATYASTCEELGEEVEVLRTENARLNEMMKAAVAETDIIKEQRERDLSAFRSEKAELSRIHDDHIATLKREHVGRESTMQHQVEELKRDISRFTDANVRSADADAVKRADDMQKVLHLRDGEVRRLRQMLSEKESALEDAEKRAVDVAAIASGITTSVVELKQFIAEAAEYAVSLSAAYSHIGVDASQLAACWRSLLASQGSPSGPLKESLEELTMLSVGIRSASRQEKVNIGHCLRQVVKKQSQLLETVATKESERHNVVELNRKRLEELERDRKAEREMLHQKMEKERLKGMLATSPRAGIEDTQLSPIIQRPQMQSVALQTGIELIDFGRGRDDAHVLKLRSEIQRLQQEVAQYRETVQMLEKQRRHFLFFVDDEDVSVEVQQALSGSRSSYIRQRL